LYNPYLNHKVRLDLKQGYYPPTKVGVNGTDYKYSTPASGKISIGSISYGSSYSGPSIDIPGVINVSSYGDTRAGLGSGRIPYRTKVITVGETGWYPYTAKTLEFYSINVGVSCSNPAGFVKTGVNPNTGLDIGYATDSLPYIMSMGGETTVYVDDPPDGIPGFKDVYWVWVPPKDGKAGYYDKTKVPGHVVERKIGAGFTQSWTRYYYGSTTGDSTGRNNYIQFNDIEFKILELYYEDPAFSPYF
jgi:hypothetical protein